MPAQHRPNCPLTISSQLLDGSMVLTRRCRRQILHFFLEVPQGWVSLVVMASNNGVQSSRHLLAYKCASCRPGMGGNTEAHPQSNLWVKSLSSADYYFFLQFCQLDLTTWLFIPAKASGKCSLAVCQDKGDISLSLSRNLCHCTSLLCILQEQLFCLFYSLVTKVAGGLECACLNGVHIDQLWIQLHLAAEWNRIVSVLQPAFGCDWRNPCFTRHLQVRYRT